MQQTADELLNLIDQTAEQQVLAAALRKEQWLQAVVHYSPDIFSKDNRILMFEAVQRLTERGQPLTPDAVTVEAKRCAMQRKLRNVNVVTKEMVRSAMAFDLPEDLDVVGRAKVLENLRRVRRYRPKIDELVNLVASRPEPGQITDAVVGLMMTLSHEDEKTDSGVLHGWDVPKAMAEMIDAYDNKTGQRPRFVWPWPRAFKDITPLMRGTMGIWAGSDGTGKSTSGETLAEFWAEKHKIQVVYVHTEYSTEHTLLRWASARSGASMKRMEQGNFTPKQLQILKQAAEKMPPTLHFLHAGGKTMSEIIAELYAFKMSGHLDVVIFDFFGDHRLPDQNRGSTEYQILGHDMRDFHAALDDFDAAGLVIAQGRKDLINADPAMVNRSMIDLPASALRKAQLNILLAPRILTRDGEDSILVPKDGVMTIQNHGQAGNQSIYVNIIADKSNFGPRTITALMRTPGYRFQEIPEPLLDFVTRGG